MHGRRYESLAVEKYEDLTNTKTRECGLFVSAQNPILGASPDRIVNDKLLVEVSVPMWLGTGKFHQVQYLT